MRRFHRPRPVLVLAALAASFLAALSIGAASAPLDRLAAEIALWSSYVKDNPSKDESWTQLKNAIEPTLDRARLALASGRRYLALQRLAPARVNLQASKWSDSQPAVDREQEAAFEAAWTKMGTVLKADLEKPRSSALDGVRPAAVRAIAETALPQVRAYYEAALEYGRATQPGTGLYYVGLAQAEKDLAAFCRSLSTKGGPPPPPLRSLEPDLDALETELLALYRPPASIDRHTDFIRASSTLKEARELDAAGLRYGALLRLLNAAQGVAALQASPGDAPASDPAAVRAALADFEKRIGSRDVDHSIAQLYLEAAQSDLDGSTPPLPGAAPGSAAAAIAKGVLPRYFTAIAPGTARPPRAAPQVTVTLVRWPYT
jgi:hypothetical protein